MYVSLVFSFIHFASTDTKLVLIWYIFNAI